MKEEKTTMENNSIQETKNPYEPNDTYSIFRNQGEREATVIAVIGNQFLIEYVMPKGTTALQLMEVKPDGSESIGKSVSYLTISTKWLKAIVAAEMSWEGWKQGLSKHYRVIQPEVMLKLRTEQKQVSVSDLIIDLRERVNTVVAPVPAEPVAAAPVTDNTETKETKCPDCDGRGFNYSDGDGSFEQHRQKLVCKTCVGNKGTITQERRCRACGNYFEVSMTKEQEKQLGGWTAQMYFDRYRQYCPDCTKGVK